MTAEEIAKKIRTDEMNGCNNDEFCELHVELIRSYALQIAEKAVGEETEIHGWVRQRILSRIKTETGGE